MNLGLKRGTVELLPHQDIWKDIARDTISLLSTLLDHFAVAIEHVGSTAIRSISAKPIIDIVVGVKELDDIMAYIQLLEENGIMFRGEDVGNQYLFVIGDLEKDTRTHHIHIVEYNSIAWNNYINFRDYLNSHKDKAKEYERLKIQLAGKYYCDRVAYTEGKQEFIDEILALAENFDEE